ncbi:TetR/AcrR family transcriptional regulator [Companilactobacillus halodurans]|uniref:TetR/AcrR family transcriptional regulator n=1 Tax=Companilactobacillus halodurans TaxID=2584183 RepID=A0A5P0ZPG7_9LACO|nr:TetR/AcrR family transcriptional regulator [Companilactobacillus halodurans]MQS76106.1 TetR/AcrR family transcriptional regulator [Companilactobacillus halodurans]MQS96541.1 TetR/AcrR family transcriptional regulator [Companilactobacillus halodurans]
MEKITNLKIIETAELLIEETGKPEVSIPQIANKMGITHGAIYKHFGSKQELWETVAQKWFNQNIVEKISIDESINDSKKQLYDWLWKFINAKKQAYLSDKRMFDLNTKYVDNNPYVLREVLTGCYHTINRIMKYDDNDIKRAETILSAFSVFTLPNFKDSWKDSEYESRFNAMWNLIKLGL